MAESLFYVGQIIRLVSAIIFIVAIYFLLKIRYSVENMGKSLDYIMIGVFALVLRTLIFSSTAFLSNAYIIYLIEFLISPSLILISSIFFLAGFYSFYSIIKKQIIRKK